MTMVIETISTTKPMITATIKNIGRLSVAKQLSEMKKKEIKLVMKGENDDLVHFGDQMMLIK